ncbi:MAG: preprotein translocase subunit SecA [Chloroflexota bacterium]|nr:preprotein translocase subunit SecA [Chloroflexota bacterium]MDE2884889.1 preprotein translocase subunit SecA [Chloroflexota bacterium]
MLGKLLNVFGDSNDKEIKRYQRVVETVGGLESSVAELSDSALADRTAGFRERIARSEGLEDLLPEAFAVVREAARRAIGLRHFDVQLIGGGALHDGKVAEMKTGEGKTLVATLPVYLNALEGKGVHVVTVNDYLARRDAMWMGKVYSFLGLSVGCLQHESSFALDPGYRPDSEPPEMRPVPRREAYGADITYGTNNEFGFDYLRDNMAASLEQKVQRDLHYAIVDEVDNILIDEARTPLIISGPSQEPTTLYGTVARVVPRLQADEDYTIAEKERQALLTDAGISKIESLLNVGNLYDPSNYVLTHFVENALRAQFVYQRDKDYVVKDGEVVIVDEFTGRLMPGRRYGEGLHQAIEAKENVRVQRETITYATVTLQNYFRMYGKLAGMTGTALTEAEEFFKVYGLEVLAVPTNAPMIREDHPDFVYKTHAGKFKAVVDHIEELNTEGRPVLVGTTSIERSEQLSALLRRRGIKHEVLNAKNHEREAQIVAEAGKPGAVTVSTNMAGRGTDIILGGDPSSETEPGAWRKAHDEVVDKGGLCVIGTERHESRRIDNQLRGRSGRQGDPGETRFYGSLEDEILTRFSGGMVGRLVGKAFVEDAPLESGMLTRSLEMTQGKAESYFFDIRKHLVEYDDVVNRQREVIYAERDKVLEGADLRANIQEMIGKEISSAVHTYLAGEPEQWEVEPLLADVGVIMPLPVGFDAGAILRERASQTEDTLLTAAEGLYEEREEQYGADTMRAIERAVMLQTIDRLWVQHLTMMSNLRQGIGLYAYGQRDPLVMYKKQGHEAFDGLLERVQHDIVRTIFHVAPAGQAAARAAGTNGRAATVDTARTETVMAKAIGPRRTAAPAAPVDVPPDAPRWMRRQAERAAGGGKKARKRKGR